MEEVPDSDDEDEVHFDKNVEELVGEQQEETGTEVGDRSQGTQIYYTNTKLKALYILKQTKTTAQTFTNNILFEQMNQPS